MFLRKKDLDNKKEKFVLFHPLTFISSIFKFIYLQKLNLLVLCVIIGIIGVCVTIFTFEFTSTSKFCSFCHYMDPYIESWSNSTHKNVKCFDCHIAPGFLNYVVRKMQAVKEVALYVTKTYPPRPHAEVPDEACMRPGCHTDIKDTGPVEYKRGIMFSHKSHLTKPKRGKKLACISCHGQLVQERGGAGHVVVTQQTCNLCHLRFIDDVDTVVLKDGHVKKMNDCRICHKKPPVMDKEKDPDRYYDHKDVDAKGLSCVTCHSNVVEGTGDAVKEKCYLCHARMDHIEKYSDRNFVHAEHISKHKISCYECHEPLRHKLSDKFQHLGDSCKLCHKESLNIQFAMFSGQMGKDVESAPSVKYELKMGCNSCHGDALECYSPEYSRKEIHEKRRKSCIKCHSEDRTYLIDEWQESTKSLINEIYPKITKVSKIIKKYKNHKNYDKALALLKDTKYNINFIIRDKSFGVHNIEYTNSMLFNAQDNLDKIKELLTEE